MNKTYNGFNSYDEFTNYVMNRITIEQRRQIRKQWNNLKDSVNWQSYLLSEVNKLTQ